MYKNNTNIYLPQAAIIKQVLLENSQIKTFILSFVDAEYNRAFTYQPGQFMMVSIPHCGEAPISFSSSPTRPGTIQLSIRKAGKLTDAIHELQSGAVVGLRGPYGRPFPMDNLKKKDLLFVAGGIGLAPLRSVINYCLSEFDAAASGMSFQTVRGVFVEGHPAFPGAGIRTRTHVQIAVRDPSCILGFFKPGSSYRLG